MPKPIGYMVTIEMDKVEEKKIGSIFVPESSKILSDETVEKGTVLELGPLAYAGLANGASKEPWIKPGDRVYVKAYGGRRFRFKSGRHIRLVNDEDINCLISAEDESDELV
jgi:co-chaperonin GroES (HSP10)